MKETFITGVNDNNNNDHKTNVHINRRSSCVSEINLDLKNKKDDLIKVKENLLDFLIEEKANFADFDKIYEHYQKELKENYRKYNHNKLIIDKKEQEYKSILLSIETKIVNNLTFQKKDSSFYDVIIDNIKKQIRLKEHELECYTNMHSRLYKTNYLMIKTYKNQLLIQQLNDEQYDKFNLIQNQAISMFKKQNSALKSLIRYREIMNEEYEKMKKKKIQRINNLELDVYDIKKDNHQLERYINRIKDKQEKIKQKIKFETIIKNKTKTEIKTIRKDYFSLMGKLIFIYSSFNIKDIKNIKGFIKKLNENENNNHQLHIMFIEENKVITEMQNKLSLLSMHKNKIDSKIENCKNIKEDLIDYNEIKNSINGLKEENKIILKNFIKAKNNFILLLSFLVNYSNKLNSKLKKNSLSINGIYKLSIDFLVDNFGNFMKINHNEHIYSIDFDFLKQKLNRNNIKRVLQFFIRVFKIFNYNLFSIINYQTNKISRKLLKKSIGTKYEIIKIQNEEFKKIYNKKVEKYFNTEHTRTLYLQKAEREVLKRLESGNNKRIKSKEEKNRKLIKTKFEISGEDLYLTYLNYMNNKSKTSRNNTFNIEAKTQNNFIKNHPRRSIAIIGDFSNNLVLSPNTHSSNFLRKSLIDSNKNKTMSNFFKSKENEILSQKKNSFRVKSTKHNEEEFDDSDIKDQELYNNEEKKQIVKKKKINNLFNSKDPEMSNILIRANELRKLELHFFKKKEKDILETINFNKYYKLLERHNKKKNFPLKNNKNDLNLQKNYFSNKQLFPKNNSRNIISPERSLNYFSTSSNEKNKKFNSRYSVDRKILSGNKYSNTITFKKQIVKKSKSTAFIIQINPKEKSSFFS